MVKVLLIRLIRKSGVLSEDGGDEELFEHKAVARNLSILDAAAEHAELHGLSDFFSEDPDNVHDLVDDEDEAEKLLATMPKVRWFPPADALPTVVALLEAMDEGESVAGIKNRTQVIAELQDIQTVLEYAESKRATFRFFQDF